jgi:tRNA (cmo5U34)-methyltransferase
MSDFDTSQWADSEFSQEYRKYANDYLPDRFKLIEIVKSFFRHFIYEVDAPRVLDLGCGDGLLMQELMKSDNRIRATLVDGFSEMLESAKKRLADFRDVQFVQATFQDLLVDDPLHTSFDFILSSFAIHHLETQEKKALFEYIYHHLSADGFFLNLDVVLAPYQDLEEWYLSLWREWISASVDSARKPDLLPIPQQYKDNPDNFPDTLSSQLEALQAIGFKNVDCFYKYGIFTIFGGKR